jgi:hypothetical protein
MATQWTAQGITSGAVLPAATLQSIGAVWESYTPTVKAGATTLTGTVNLARYCQIQKTVILQVLFTPSNTGAVNGIITVSYPVGLVPATATNRPIGSFLIVDTGSLLYAGIALAHENAGDTHRSICRRMDMDMDMTFNPSKALIALVGLNLHDRTNRSRRNRTRSRLTDHHNDCGLLSRKRHGRTI